MEEVSLQQKKKTPIIINASEIDLSIINKNIVNIINVFTPTSSNINLGS